MTPMRRAIWFLAGASVLGGPVIADLSHATPDPHLRQSFHMEVPVSPAPVPIAGATQLVYELHLTNFAHDTLTLTNVEVIDDSSGAVIGESGGASLEALLGRPGLATGATGRRAVAPGMRAIVYFNVSVTAAMVPRTFHHRVEFGVMTGDQPTHATAAVRDDMAEPTNCVDRAPSGALEDDAGNYIVLDIGRGRYAFYEHLQPAVLVKPGDRVRRGQVIGTLGCTGSASMPHLHFHVGDAPLPLEAEGLPYVLTNFHVLGIYDTIEQFDRGEMWRERSARSGAWAGASFPASSLVVRFPEE